MRCGRRDQVRSDAHLPTEGPPELKARGLEREGGRDELMPRLIDAKLGLLPLPEPKPVNAQCQFELRSGMRMRMPAVAVCHPAAASYKK